jgi:hypothetical protein
MCWLRAYARRAGASALVACVGLTATSSSLPGTTVLSPVFTPNTKITLQWNGLPEDYKFDPFVDSEHTDDYHTKDNKDAWGPKVRALDNPRFMAVGTFLPHAKNWRGCCHSALERRRLCAQKRGVHIVLSAVLTVWFVALVRGALFGGKQA